MEENFPPHDGFCKLASLIRREIANPLLQDSGVAVERLGCVRTRIWDEGHRGDEVDEDGYETAARDRLSSNWCPKLRSAWPKPGECWPLAHLAAITGVEIAFYNPTPPPLPPPQTCQNRP